MRPRRVMKALLAGGVSALAAGGFAPTVATAASAADTVTVAGGSSYTYTFNQSPSIQATAQPNCRSVLSSPGQVTLTIAGPAVSDSTLASHKGSCNKAVSLSPSSSSVNTRHAAWAGGGIASNGVYTVTLNNQGRTTSASFTLLIPPARPTGFTVTPNSATSATFAWSANPEPDIVGYEIKNSAGTVVASPSSSACSGGSCSTGVTDLGSSVSGHDERYSLTAVRSCGDASCSAGHLASTSTASGSATFPAAPTPTPSATPTTSTGGTGGGHDSGGGHGGDGTSLGTVHSNGGPGHGSVNLGNADAAGQVSHNLPPVSVGSVPRINAPRLPGVRTSIKPLDPGAPPGKIKYPSPLVAQQHADKSLADDIKSGLSLPPLWRGIAAAAVLILIAVHLRAWVARTDAF